MLTSFMVLTAIAVYCHKESEPELKGRLETVSGYNMLTVWGSNYEMGYAQGYLLGESFLEMFDEYLVYDYFGYPENYEINIRPYVIDHCVPVAQSLYADELEGLFDGWKQLAVDSGWSTTSTALGRELDITDFYVAQFVPDFAGFPGSSSMMCSSLSAWGNATKSDTALAGGVVYCRILDWSAPDILVYNTVIVVYDPEDESEHGWVSFGYPFLIGSLSGFSEDGICASYNLGNYNLLEDESGKFIPILWSIRRGLETDANGDGYHTADDVYACVKTNPRFGTHIIHCAEPSSQDQTNPAFVIEANNTATTIRYSADEPDIAPGHLIATNHHRKLYPPTGCSRYQELLAEFEADPAISTERAWALEDSVSTWWSVMKVLIRPDNRDFYFTYGDGIDNPLDDALHCTLDNLFE